MNIYLQCYFHTIAYKVAIGYTPYQLMYGLHLVMPIEYIIPVVGGDEKDNVPVNVLITRIIKSEKL
jgi:hypothetical protein